MREEVEVEVEVEEWRMEVNGHYIALGERSARCEYLWMDRY